MGNLKYRNCSPAIVTTLYNLYMEILVNICYYRGRWRGCESSFRFRWNVGLVGPNYQFQISNQLTLIFYVGNYVNNFWCTPKYHFLEGRWYGEWIRAWGLAILQFLLLMVSSIDQSSRRSSSNFQQFQNGASRGKWFANDDLIARELSGKLNLFFVKSQ